MPPSEVQKSLVGILFCLSAGITSATAWAASSPVIVDHRCTRLSLIPEDKITAAKSQLHIAYGHTSHGSQLTTGMTGLVDFKGGLYAWNSGGAGGALDLRDQPFSGAADLGNPDRTAWETATRAYLNAHPDVNVIIWSWCGQVSSATAADIDTYLGLMNGLEADYPGVKFVYMTGHLDGGGLTGNLHLRNEQIRNYCRANNKILYDFADIETYDPSGTYFGDKIPDDACGYDSDGDGARDRNWAQEWQAAHAEGVDWYGCDSAHSEPVNANQKAYAAWWLWARLAGWQGSAEALPAPVLSQVYPNPAREAVRFRLQGEYSSQVRLLLLNLAGETVLKHDGDFTPPGGVVSIDASRLAPGMYFYKIYYDGRRGEGGKICIRR